jgi:NADP-dependent aldehyde dehydrogenase
MTELSSALSYIAGRWHCASGEAFHSQRPEDGSPVSSCTSCDAADVDEAVTAAVAAAEQLAHKSPADIAAFLNALAEEIENLGQDLIDEGMAESGLPEARLTGERGRTCNQIRAFANLVAEGSWVEATIDTAQPDREPLPKPDIRAQRTALGPVAVFGASNFPFAFGSIGGDTASALAAGNPVVIKGHPSHPGTSTLFAKAVDAAINRCEFPEGTVSLLQGIGNDLGQALVAHPGIKAVGFTGSTAGGRALMDIAAARPEPIPVYAEMGSINPVFLMPDALASRGEEVAQAMAQSVAMGTGQFCTSPGILVTLRDENFTQTLAAAMAEAPRGYMLNQGIAAALEASHDTLAGLANLDRLAGGSCDTPMQPLNSLYRCDATTFLNTPQLLDEVFGPASILVECNTEEEMLAIANAMEGNLTATIHTDQPGEPLVAAVLQRLSQCAGRVLFNGFPTGVEVCPAMQHGGPYPASSAAATTSVGTAAITRFTRRVCLQNCPDELLPAALQSANPLGIWRQIDGEMTRDTIA